MFSSKSLSNMLPWPLLKSRMEKPSVLDPCDSQRSASIVILAGRCIILFWHHHRQNEKPIPFSRKSIAL